MQTDTVIYDIAGVGIGPFNLGLAALTEPVSTLRTIFIEQQPEFNWHGGMMIPGTTLQVSYLADLVTLADPSSKFSYLNFLRAHNRLIQFGIHEQGYITRSEYNRYCRWVCSRLPNLLFGNRVQRIQYEQEKDLFTLTVYNSNKGTIHNLLAKKIVVGIGTEPHWPCSINRRSDENILHSADYMYRRSRLAASSSIALVGSGQSAAEIFYDLLHQVDLGKTSLHWYTRSDRFYAMEHSKLNYEMTSPDYIDFFYRLEPGEKQRLLKNQATLYKGINYQLINCIYDKLYEFFIEGYKHSVKIQAHAELKGIAESNDGMYILDFYHNAQHTPFSTKATDVVLATGYYSRVPDFLSPLEYMIQRDRNGALHIKRNYSIDDNNQIFIQNAELHTHGFNAPDLGLGAYRNAVIINTILGDNYYPVDSGIGFQSFDCAV